MMNRDDFETPLITVRRPQRVKLAEIARLRRERKLGTVGRHSRTCQRLIAHRRAVGQFAERCMSFLQLFYNHDGS